MSNPTLWRLEKGGIKIILKKAAEAQAHGWGSSAF